MIGLLVLGGDDCPVAQTILDKRDVVSLRKRAGDAAYGLASQLLAALANLSAGAEKRERPGRNRVFPFRSPLPYSVGSV